MCQLKINNAMYLSTFKICHANRFMSHLCHVVRAYVWAKKGKITRLDFDPSLVLKIK